MTQFVRITSYLGHQIDQNMTFEEFTAKVTEAVADAPNVGKKLKLKLDEGAVLIDMTGDKAVVSNDDTEADTTIKTSIETLDKLRSGNLNPMMAMMTGKLKIDGDMGLAMKLQSLLS